MDTTTTFYYLILILSYYHIIILIYFIQPFSRSFTQTTTYPHILALPLTSHLSPPQLALSYPAPVPTNKWGTEIIAACSLLALSQIRRFFTPRHRSCLSFSLPSSSFYPSFLTLAPWSDNTRTRPYPIIPLSAPQRTPAYDQSTSDVAARLFLS